MKRGSVAIVGVAESDLGAVAALMSPIDLMAQGIHRALADAGQTLKDVDGLFCATTQARTSAMSLVEYLGLPNAYTDSTIVGGSSFEVHVAHAHAALEAWKAVMLSASGLPAGATATFNPASVMPGSSSASSTLTIQTASSTTAAGSAGHALLALASVPGFATLFFAVRRRKPCNG